MRSSRQLFSAARGLGGSGIAFIPLINARGTAASGRAKALVLSKFTTFVATGIAGELTVDSNKDYFTKYDRLKRVLPATQRPPAAVEQEMVSTMAHSDPGIRELWGLRTAVAPPSSLQPLGTRSHADHQSPNPTCYM